MSLMLSWPSNWGSSCTGASLPETAAPETAAPGTAASGTASVLIQRSYVRTGRGPGGHADQRFGGPRDGPLAGGSAGVRRRRPPALPATPPPEGECMHPGGPRSRFPGDFGHRLPETRTKTRREVRHDGGRPHHVRPRRRRRSRWTRLGLDACLLQPPSSPARLPGALPDRLCGPGRPRPWPPAPMSS